MQQTIFITGTNSGFGNLTVKTLLKNGHRVIATMRNMNSKNLKAAKELAGLGAQIFEMDVTSDESVETAIINAQREVGTIDALINNAGLGVLGQQEAFSAEELKRVFDVNVIGVHRVMRAIAPHFRELGNGLVINTSSLLGRITIPYYGPYNAAKWALEALTENYRTELSGFGIEVCMVEPGGFPTTFMDNLMQPSDQSIANYYKDINPSPKSFFDYFEKALESNPAQNPQNVADAHLKLVEMPRGERPFRTIVDKMGMGDHIEGYNQNLAMMTQGIYSAFGINSLLELKK